MLSINIILVLSSKEKERQDTQGGSYVKEDLCIEAQERGKNCALIIKNSLFEGIFIDAKGVNCASLETVRAKKYFL